MEIEITQLAIYPVKSCGAIALTSSPISTSGLQWDREWMIVDSMGYQLTQRTMPTMVLIQPTLTDKKLVLEAPGMPLLAIELASKPVPAVSVRIWDDASLGADEGDSAAEWISGFLGHSCRLLRVHPQARRGVAKAWVRQWQRRSHQSAPELEATLFGFADGFPFLICNQASLDELNSVILDQNEQIVSMRRFRPNIVIDGLDAYDEDYALRITGSGHYFAKLKNCTRCPLPNVDPDTAAVGKQPQAALVASRTTAEGVLFGVNAGLYQRSDTPSINVGDRLHVDLGF